MIEPLLQQLEKLNKEHVDEGFAVTKAFGGAVYPFDLLTFGVLNRSMSLTSGFITLMRAENYVAAVTFVRPQLDNFLRYAAGWLVDDPHKFATNILSGIPVKNMNTSGDDRMTDRFLVDHFKKDHPWIDPVYTETCGIIHLSEKHILMSVNSTDSETGHALFSISDKHSHVPPELRADAVKTFIIITKQVLHRIYSWRVTKDNPPGQSDNKPKS